MTNVRQNWYPAILMALAAAAPSFAENAAPSMETFAKLPLAFERNQGQADSRVAFMAHGIAYSVFLTKQEAVLTLAGDCRRARSRQLCTSTISSGEKVM